MLNLDRLDLKKANFFLAFSDFSGSLPRKCYSNFQVLSFRPENINISSVWKFFKDYLKQFYSNPCHPFKVNKCNIKIIISVKIPYSNIKIFFQLFFKSNRKISFLNFK